MWTLPLPFGILVRMLAYPDIITRNEYKQRTTSIRHDTITVYLEPYIFVVNGPLVALVAHVVNWELVWQHFV